MHLIQANIDMAAELSQSVIYQSGGQGELSAVPPISETKAIYLLSWHAFLMCSCAILRPQDASLTTRLPRHGHETALLTASMQPQEGADARLLQSETAHKGSKASQLSRGLSPFVLPAQCVDPPVSPWQTLVPSPSADWARVPTLS